MADGQLEPGDVENAILRGRIDKRLTFDERGTRYRIEGPAEDGRTIHVVCRFRELGSLIVITAYELSLCSSAHGHQAA